MRYHPGIFLEGLKQTVKILILHIVQVETRQKHLQDKSSQLHKPEVLLKTEGVTVICLLLQVGTSIFENDFKFHLRRSVMQPHKLGRFHPWCSFNVDMRM